MQVAKLGRGVAYALAFVLLAALLTGRFMDACVVISRSVTVAAPPAAVYPLISDFKNGWARWNAFADEDPGMVYAYQGPAAGVGAVQSWTSKKLGNGTMTMTAADSAASVSFTLGMGEGGKEFSLVGHLLLEPDGAGTKVTWIDTADLGGNPAKRLMGPVLQKMMGKSFEKSLAGLRKLAEQAHADSSAPNPTASPARDTAAARP